MFKLNLKEKKYINHKVNLYNDKRAASVDALKIIQKNHGWVSDYAISEISKFLNIPISNLEEIATFYSQIYRKPVGKNIIQYCDSIVCYLNGYEYILSEIEKLLNIKPGETTSNGLFTLLPVCCLGNCDKGPIIMIGNNTYINLSLEKIKFILNKYK